MGVSGYEVRFIKNITDVGHLTDDDIAQGDSGEDKMLKKARIENKDPYEIARFYENAAREAESEMNITPAHYHPRATEHIPQMIDMIDDLIAKGHAYVCDDDDNGHVFFDIESFPQYGQLSGNTLDKLKIGARLEEPMSCKKNQWDFALWLKAPKNHLMQWESPWGRGYPGWHIECSAMSMEYLGNSFDIHTGGEDNIFPHHEAEIAQSQCATNSNFVNYWMHSRFLLVDGKKMSKSKGNFYTLDSIKEKGFEPMDLRMLYLLSHYRSQMDFTWKGLEQARINRKTIQRFYERLLHYESSWVNTEADSLELNSQLEKAKARIRDDLNTPDAIAFILGQIKGINTLMDTGQQINVEGALKLIEEIVVRILGIKLDKPASKIPKEIVDLAEKREQARANKDFALSDQLRDEISAAGYVIEDAPDGYKLSKK